MSAEILTAPVETPTHEDLRIGHLVYEHNPRLALCGKRLKGIVCFEEVEVCVVCKAMAEDLGMEL